MSVQRTRLILYRLENPLQEFLELTLRRIGYEVKAVSELEGSNLRQDSLLPVVIAEAAGSSSAARLKSIRNTHPGIPVVILGGDRVFLDSGSAAQTRGFDGTVEAIDSEEIRSLIEQALHARRQVPDVDSRLNEMFFGTNPLMQQIRELLPRVGASDVPVLIQGETGTGKEVLARQLCAWSHRAGKPFVKLNCAALPGELIESELFGYERGAFTGAMQRKLGLFEVADNGTILLDEIGDMDVRLQAKLLQVLQDREIRRLGGKESIPVNVRLIAATHRNLEDGIRQNTFREDLYYRLNVFTFTLPPLRKRREDIPDIAEFLLRRQSDPHSQSTALTDELRLALKEYNWPGNIRELGNVLRRLTLLRDPNLTIQELRNKAASQSQRETHHSAMHIVPIESNHRSQRGLMDLNEVSRATQSAERDAILSALNATRWNRKQAARLLKVDYKALLYRIKKLNIDKAVPTTPPRSLSEPEGPLRPIEMVPQTTPVAQPAPRVMKVASSHAS